MLVRDLVSSRVQDFSLASDRASSLVLAQVSSTESILHTYSP